MSKRTRGSESLGRVLIAEAIDAGIKAGSSCEQGSDSPWKMASSRWKRSWKRREDRRKASTKAKGVEMCKKGVGGTDR